MIYIKKTKGEIFFNLIIIYRLGWFSFTLIREQFDSNKFTRKEIELIENNIRIELDKKFR